MHENEPALHSIWIAAEAATPLRSVRTVRAIAGVGLAGDRYAAGTGTFSRAPATSVRDLSLVAFETVARVAATLEREIDPGDLRRNLVTSGLELAPLVGARLRIGEVVLECTGTCPPCAHLDRLLEADVGPLLRNRGGLRARILTDGELVAGTAIEILRPPRRLP